MTPTKDNPVVIARVPQDAADDAEPARELRAFRWGFLPNYSPVRGDRQSDSNWTSPVCDLFT